MKVENNLGLLNLGVDFHINEQAAQILLLATSEVLERLF